MTTLEPAVFSPCRTYRYVLRRPVGLGGGTCLFVMLNPSTADETVNDPTIRRCMGFARDWGYGLLLVANLFALRSTDPRALYAAEDPVGPENDRHILAAASEAGVVVCAWGNHGAHLDRGRAVASLLKGEGVEARCLGVTGTGQPRHPLYIPKAQALEVLR